MTKRKLGENFQQLSSTSSNSEVVKNPLTVDEFGGLNLHPSYKSERMTVVQFLELIGTQVPSTIATGLKEIFGETFVQTGAEHLEAVPSLEAVKHYMEVARVVGALNNGGIPPQMQQRIDEALHRGRIKMFQRHGFAEDRIPASGQLSDAQYPTPVIPPARLSDEQYLRPGSYEHLVAVQPALAVEPALVGAEETPGE